VTFFNRIFLSLVKRYGRVYEMELIGRFNTGTLNFFKDVMKAPKLFFKGRLKLWPSFEGRKTANTVFKDLERIKSSKQVEKSTPPEEL
jgi:heterodisulfide reductase subunit C